MSNLFSGRIKIYSLFIGLYMCMHVLFYFILFAFFVNLAQSTSSDDILYSFYLNFKFNMRLSFIALLPIVLLSIFPRNIFNTFILRKIAIFYSMLIFVFTFIIYLFDLAYYLYLGNRIDATVFRFLEDFKISLEFAYQSYPIFWLFLLVLVSSIIFYFLLSRLFSDKNLILIPRKKLYKISSSILVFIVIVGAMHAKFSQYPLRWSEVYFSKDRDIATLSLNPILNLFDTFKYRKSNFRKIENIDEKEKLLKKDIATSTTFNANQNTNIIVVMMESVNINRLGFMGNSLNPTPNLDKIIKEGYIFTNFFVPSRSTAQSVFASLFGIPDVSHIRTASRNPFIKTQHSLVNDLENYQKHYFIGGSLSWANTRGLLNKFIPDMELFEGEYHSPFPRVDVWGLSDRDLFKEAHNKLESISSKPFFAYIQTAGNHRPFSIPEQNKDYEIKKWSKKELNDNGFTSSDYFNGINLLDYSIGEFIKDFKKSSYYDNTIIVFFGDHGITSTGTEFIRKSDFELNIYENHVPLIIYAPSIIKQSKLFKRTSYLPDMLPTVLSLAKQNIKSKTLGVDLLNLNNKRKTAFLTGKGLIQNDLFLKINNTKFDLYDLNKNEIIDDEDKKSEMIKLFNAFDDVSSYYLYGKKQ